LDEETGMVALSDLPGGDVASFAYDASADGSIVVGWGTGTGGTTSALFWDAEGQMHDLNSIVSGIPYTAAGR
jgi:probable HAF family extracellular repeat protein